MIPLVCLGYLRLPCILANFFPFLPSFSTPSLSPGGDIILFFHFFFINLKVTHEQYILTC